MIPTDQWTIDPARTAIIVFAFPDNSLSMEAVGWISQRFPMNHVLSVNMPNVCCARNSAVRNLIVGPSKTKLTAQFEDFIFIDRDMRPSDASDHFLTLDIDVAGCRYDVGSPLPWQYPNAVHLGLCRIRRKVFHTMAAPWFEMPLSEDGCSMKTCECVSFAEKAKRLGFTVGAAGWCDHKPSHSWGHG